MTVFMYLSSKSMYIIRYETETTFFIKQILFDIIQ